MTMAARDAEKLSEQVRRAVASCGMSRYAICKAIGLAESNMSRFMARRSGLSMDTLDRLGLLLELRITANRVRQPKHGNKA